jgi:integrase
MGTRSILDHHLLPALGRRPLAQVSKAETRDLVATLAAAGKQRNTQMNIVRSLSAIYNFAIQETERSGITKNPAAPLAEFFGGKRKMNLIGPIREDEVYTAEQVAHLFQVAAEYFPGADGALPVQVAFLTGLREGELFALQPGDLNCRGGFLVVNRIIAYRQGRLIIDDTSKGDGAGERVVVPDRLLAALGEMLSLREAEAALAGHAPSPWLFPADTDPLKPRNPSVFYFYRYVWQRLVKLAGLHHIPFHNARHSFATTSLEKGLGIEWVSRQLRHADVSTTWKYYSGFIPERNRDKANRLADAIDAGGAVSEATPGEKSRPFSRPSLT